MPESAERQIREDGKPRHDRDTAPVKVYVAYDLFGMGHGRGGHVHGADEKNPSQNKTAAIQNTQEVMALTMRMEMKVECPGRAATTNHHSIVIPGLRTNAFGFFRASLNE